MTQLIRRAAVAGSFYTSNASKLRKLISSLLDDTKSENIKPKAMIVPHAGFIYSGAIAASAYTYLEKQKNNIKRVVLLGPSHFVPFRGMALSSAHYFETPLGNVSVDLDALTKMSHIEDIHVLDEAHQGEHSLEVQLPFLQLILPQFKIVPIAVGWVEYSFVAHVIDELWGTDETCILISSDLSHYHDYNTAKELDQKTTEAIESLNPDSILEDHACGRIPVQGLLEVARKRNMKVHTVDLRNSGDTQGNRDRVVGYGAYVFEE